MSRTIVIRFVALPVIVAAAFLLVRPRPDRIEFYRARIGGPATYPAYTGLGAAYYQRARMSGAAADYAEAERLLRQSLAFQPNAEAMKWLAATLADQHRFEEALTLARHSADSSPIDRDALGILFDVLLGMGNAREASLVMEKLKMDGPRFLVDVRVAAWHEFRGEFEAAARAMRRACDPGVRENVAAESRAWCYARLGLLEERLGEQGRALQSLRSSLDIVPSYALAHREMARLSKAGRR